MELICEAFTRYIENNRNKLKNDFRVRFDTFYDDDMFITQNASCHIYIYIILWQSSFMNAKMLFYVCQNCFTFGIFL